MTTYIDLTGMKFGRLTVLREEGFAHRPGRRRGYRNWLCKCDCGKEIVTMGNSLKTGNTQSCGCLRIERLKAAISKPYEYVSKKELLHAVKHNAQKAGNEWQLDDDFAVNMMLQNCHYCGSEPLGRINNGFMYNGLDRVDNAKGYVPGNVVTCCMHCNRAKRTRSVEEFLAWVSQVYEHSISRKEG